MMQTEKSQKEDNKSSKTMSRKQILKEWGKTILIPLFLFLSISYVVPTFELQPLDAVKLCDLGQVASLL